MKSKNVQLSALKESNAKNTYTKTRRKKQNGFCYKLVKYRVFLLMLLPALLYTLVFSYIPMGGVILAFKKYSYAGGIFNSPWNGLKNFEFFFKSGQALLVTKNTVLYNLLFIAFNTCLQITVAVLLTEVKNKHFKKISQSIMFLPYFISWVIVSVIAFNLLSFDYGVINSIIEKLGGEKINFYTTGTVWPIILTLFGAWKGVGYGSVMYLAAIMGIDTSIYEAASIDGANVFQRIFKITIPLMMPTVVILFLLAVGGIFKGNFDMFYNLVGNNGVLYNYTDVIDTLTFRALISNNDFGMSAAAGLYQSVLCFVTILLVNKLVSIYSKDYTLF
ncbi:sugar ABC transporter permease [Anaerocolumna cellulosilytica]|uniref:Sugar ABC transporter permease n=2 Tax=Anaerocolumna cellulosilytica TaxID=433286 RepID=A0A6S6R9F2_9FIRM|nr:sugar ABC transporter permease [Anaerocolumna cellulosilytica]